MTGSLSDYMENKVIDHIQGKASLAMPSNVYLALCTVAPTDASTGSTITEPVGMGYSRVQVPAGSLASASSGASSNTSAITFGQVSGAGYTIVGYALCDALTGGNVILWGTLTSRTIPAGDTPQVNIGDYQVSID